MGEGVNLINNFKVISSTSQELMKISDIQNTNKKLSDKDILNSFDNFYRL